MSKHYESLNASWERALSARTASDNADRLAAQVCAQHEAELAAAITITTGMPEAECEGIPVGYIPWSWETLAPLYGIDVTAGGEAA